VVIPDAARWATIKERAADALELPLEKRRAFLERTCPDAQLRDQVERLIRSAERATTFLEEPPLELLANCLEIDDPSANLAPWLQDALGDRYTIEREIGRGGMATVYLARDERHGRRVAVKLIARHVAALESTSSGRNRFEQEISIAARLTHPHILPLHDSGAAAGLLYYIMPHVDGESLRERLIREGPLPLVDAVRVLLDIAHALAHAHRHGVVHRDIKPENILLNLDGDALVADFGVAHALAAAREADTHENVSTGSGDLIMGTPRYMAPEQAAGDPAADQRADLYSLGVLAYEVLVGAPPFSYTTAPELLRAHLREMPAPVTAARPDVPPALAALVASLLAKSPDARPQDAAAVVSALERAITHPELLDPHSDGVHLPRSRHWIVGAVAAVMLALIVFSAWPRSPPAMAAEPSIAILPFLTASGDPDDEPLSAGVTEEIMTLLGRFTGLRVVGRASMFTLAGKGLDTRAIADTLGVQFVLAGSVRRDGGRLTITPSLVDARDDRIVWSNIYESGAAVSDIFALQARIARDVAAALGVPALRSGLAGGPVVPPTTDAEAHELYLKGRHLHMYGGRGREALYRAVQYFEQALDRDPAYARAHAGLSDSYTALAIFGYEPPHAEFPKARAAAQRALALDSTLVEARSALAHLRVVYEYDWQGAEVEYQRAIAMDATYPLVRFFYAAFLNGQGRFAEALEQLRIARSMDPLAPVGILTGRIYVNARQPDRAIAALNEALQFEPRLDLAHQQLGHAFLQKQMYAEAITSLGRAAELSGVRDSAQLAYALAVAGQGEDAQHILRALLDTERERYLPPFYIALAYAGLGNADAAIGWLERAYEERASAMDIVNVTPGFDALRADTRFRALVLRMGLEPH
jgi:eukaryotic-like serine/threonine-protein kinase